MKGNNFIDCLRKLQYSKFRGITELKIYPVWCFRLIGWLMQYLFCPRNWPDPRQSGDYLDPSSVYCCELPDFLKNTDLHFAYYS